MQHLETQKDTEGTSLAIQWLRPVLLIQECGFDSCGGQKKKKGGQGLAKVSREAKGKAGGLLVWLSLEDVPPISE